MLAAAGLLDGRRATTHWAFADGLARPSGGHRGPPTDLIRDGRVATSVGVTSALDLILSFVEEDHGPEIGRRLARAGHLPAAAGHAVLSASRGRRKGYLPRRALTSMSWPQESSSHRLDGRS
ncbi:DJ-1/PfpI family protein [Pseudonocardia charpentierae]|uniref:DJ-1/PfpI family protein n=1 Tax=Pseudonocardia charpentierae TaxID=3075545 RepID=UPI0037C8928A